MKKLMFVLIVISLLIISGCGSPTTKAIEDTKKDILCPYECCDEGEYYQKKCSNSDYECIDYKCQPIDSDGDGLTNIEEKNIGTNPQLYDTDGDTLSDYQEYKIKGTNPLKENTDNDRYKDNEDPNPKTINSALINIEFLSSSWNWNIGNIIISIMGGAILSPDMEIAKPTASVKISNIGTDYTNYVNFNVIFKISNIVISTQQVNLPKLSVGTYRIETYTQPIKAGDIPTLLINMVQQQTSDWKIEIGNLDYEKFP